MPPTTSAERLYASEIDRLSQALGYKAAYELMDREYLKAHDATMRQLFHVDGGFVRAVAEIADQYPNWEFCVVSTDTTMDVRISTRAVDQEQSNKQAIIEKIEAAKAQFNKLPGVRGIADAIEMTVGEREVPEEE
jgi:hypothetical protein